MQNGGDAGAQTPLSMSHCISMATPPTPPEEAARAVAARAKEQPNKSA